MTSPEKKKLDTGFRKLTGATNRQRSRTAKASRGKPAAPTFAAGDTFRSQSTGTWVYLSEQGRVVVWTGVGWEYLYKENGP